MTCIVAYERNGEVWVGGDGAGVSFPNITARGDAKVFRNGDYLFGFTSSFRMGQLLRYRFDPEPCPDWDLEKHMATTFVDSVRECFDEYGYLQKSHGGAESGGTFIVATQGRIFTIQSDFQVAWNKVPYEAIGCGEAFAMGAMYALNNSSGLLPPIHALSPQYIVEKALDAASEFSAGVCRPYTILKI